MLMNKFNRFQSVFHTTEVSKTKPNQALTVRQIHERFVKGKPLPASKTPIVEPKVDNMMSPMREKYVDYTDLFAYGEYLDVKLNEQTELLNTKQEAFLKAQAEHNQKTYKQLHDSLKDSLKSS